MKVDESNLDPTNHGPPRVDVNEFDKKYSIVKKCGPDPIHQPDPTVHKNSI